MIRASVRLPIALLAAMTLSADVRPPSLFTKISGHKSSKSLASLAAQSKHPVRADMAQEK